MTRISIVDEEESFSDSTTASCNTTDCIESAIEDESGPEISLQKYQEEQIQDEAARDFYHYCRYYYQFINQAEDDDDDELEQEEALSRKRDQQDSEFREKLAASVLSILIRLATQADRNSVQNQGSMNEKSDLRPKFAILKHKPEVLVSTSTTGSAKSAGQTPDWYFNIPDSLNPFPDFGPKNSEG